MSAPRKAPDQLFPLCREAQQIDDALGQRSDHEGDEGGPTYRVFVNSSKAHFDAICEEQIYNHGRGLRLWKKLRRLNSTQP